MFGPPSSSSDDGSNEAEAEAEAGAGARRVRRNPMEGVGKWSTRLEREIVEQDYLSVCPGRRAARTSAGGHRVICDRNMARFDS
jgi:hypothetical protein